jgi:hypothetical protein
LITRIIFCEKYNYEVPHYVMFSPYMHFNIIIPSPSVSLRGCNFCIFVSPTRATCSAQHNPTCFTTHQGFKRNPDDGGSMVLLNIGNTAHFHTLQAPESRINKISYLLILTFIEPRRITYASGCLSSSVSREAYRPPNICLFR